MDGNEVTWGMVVVLSIFCLTHGLWHAGVCGLAVAAWVRWG